MRLCHSTKSIERGQCDGVKSCKFDEQGHECLEVAEVLSKDPLSSSKHSHCYGRPDKHSEHKADYSQCNDEYVCRSAKTRISVNRQTYQGITNDSNHVSNQIHYSGSDVLISHLLFRFG